MVEKNSLCAAIAIFHATMKTFTRSKGQSAPAAAAYRAGARFHDERTGEVHDYRRRKGVADVFIFAPDEAPVWAHDPERLWNQAEAAEVRVNSRVARELEVALPHELDDGQRAALVRDIAQVLVDRYGVAVMAAIHEPGDKGDDRNHHVHLLMTTRRIGVDGLGEKVRVLDDRKTGPEEVAFLREAVAQITNRHLVAAGRGERVDHRTLKEQAHDAAERGNVGAVVRLTRAPLRRVERAAIAMGRRGEPSWQGDLNRRIRRDNVDLADFGRYRSAVQRRTPHGKTSRSPKARVRPAPSMRLPNGPMPQGLSSALRAYLVGLCRAAEQAMQSLDRLIEAIREQASAAERLATALAARRRVHTAWTHACNAEARLLRAAARSMSGAGANDKAHERRARNAAVSDHAGRSAASPSALTRRQWAEKRRAERAQADVAAVGRTLQDAVSTAVGVLANEQPEKATRPRPRHRPRI